MVGSFAFLGEQPADTNPRLTPGRRILIFGQLSDQRDSVAVVRRLADAFDGDEVPNVIFTHYDPNQLFDGINGTRFCASRMNGADFA